MSRDKDRNSYSAFASVDSLASKPILGSDGAASWQEFRKNSGIKGMSEGTAPHMPLKKADKLGTGFKSIDEERRHEEKMRRDGNDAEMNSGYTTFKRKHDKVEMEEKKRRKLIEERIRPDKVKYFITAESFDGWKEDYVFTTRDRGTGYYWDGMDSLKKLNGVENTFGDNVSSSTTGMNNTYNGDSNPKRKKKKKKKKEKRDKEQAVIEDDANNPMVQVINAMRRRTEALNRPPGDTSQISQEAKAALTGTISSSFYQSVQPPNKNMNASKVAKLTAELAEYNWEVATDPKSNKQYYFSRKTGERQWGNPLEKLKSSQLKASESAPPVDILIDGWRATKDSIGRTYYYNRESGKTSWEKPVIKK